MTDVAANVDEQTQTVNLSSEEYSNFLRCISSLRDICTDVDIRNGVIRQRSDDKFSVFEIDLTPITQNINIPISDLKQKLDLFKIFTGADQEVEITTSQRSFSVSDQYSFLEFDNPDLDFMNNQFMQQDELDSVFVRREEDIILTAEIPEEISERIRIITSSFHVKSMQVEFTGERASVTTRTQAKDQYARVLTDITTERVMPDCFSNLVFTPFIIDHDNDIDFNMYLFDEDNGVCVNVFKTSIADTNIAVYGRSSLVDAEDIEG